MVDWTEALRVGGLGFLTVFLVLVILSLVLWLISMIMYRALHGKSKTAAKKEN